MPGRNKNQQGKNPITRNPTVVAVWEICEVYIFMFAKRTENQTAWSPCLLFLYHSQINILCNPAKLASLSPCQCYIQRPFQIQLLWIRSMLLSTAVKVLKPYSQCLLMSLSQNVAMRLRFILKNIYIFALCPHSSPRAPRTFGIF